MPQIIRRFDNHNQPIVACDSLTPLIYFNLLRLERGQRHQAALANCESVHVVLQGRCDIEAEGMRFESVGQRKDIWSGNADSVYAGSGARVEVTALMDGTEIAVAGGVCRERYAPFRITPAEVDPVSVGSAQTHSHRRIFHILGNRHAGRAGHLLVSELLCDEGAGRVIRRTNTTRMRCPRRPATRSCITTVQPRERFWLPGHVSNRRHLRSFFDPPRRHGAH